MRFDPRRPFGWRKRGTQDACTYDELMAPDKVNLGIFWLRDESLKNIANLPELDVLAQEIMEDSQSALVQLGEITKELAE